MNSRTKHYSFLPCAGVSNVGRLTLEGATDYAAEISGNVISIAAIASGAESLLQSQKAPIVVIDGCEKCCATAILKSRGLSATYHLAVTDLGITKEKRINASEEEVQLVKDGIEACCNEVDGLYPRMTGSCGCI